MFITGQELAGRFLLVRQLNNGVTPVWLARERSTDDSVVLKIFAGARAAAEAEYNQLIALSHPHILRPTMLLHAGDLALLVMPAITSGTLASLRAQPFQRFLTPVLQVARTVAWLHGQALAHGDLKPDNVLLEPSGNTQLIDFGNCLPIGATRRSDAPVSSFSASPQQRAAQPAAVADDIHGIGALLHELLYGQPPGYGAVAQLPATAHPAPAALLSLVSRCLAVDPAQRPLSMTAVVNDLENLTAAPAGGAVRPAPVPLLTPPAVAPDTVRASWRRPVAADVPSSLQLHRQGFRRGFAVAAAVALALVAIALFVLPGLRPAPLPAAATPSASTAPAPAAASTPDADRDLRELALVKSAAESLLSDLGSRLTALNSSAAGIWAAERSASANAALQAAQERLNARDYQAARTALESLAAPVAELERERTEALRRYLQQGQTALTANDASAADAAFKIALQIDPANGDARRGARRAASLDQVWTTLTRARALEQQGNIAAAAGAYREAARLDPDAAEASAGVARTSARLANDEFGRTVAQVFAAIDARQPERARSALSRARTLRPQDPALAGAEAQLAELESAGKLAAALAGARAAEGTEHWADAVLRYREALAIDTTLVEARDGLARASDRALLDEELTTIIAQPERVYSSAVYAAARQSLQRAEAIAAAGPRLGEQRTRVAALLRLADTPVQVPLVSDNLTAVTIYRVGELGSFSERRVELRPGSYTVVGTRSGYRDVRRELHVSPSAVTAPLRVVCEEPI